MPCQWIEVSSFSRLMTLIVTSSPSVQRKVGPAIWPLMEKTRRFWPSIRTSVRSITRS